MKDPGCEISDPVGKVSIIIALEQAGVSTFVTGALEVTDNNLRVVAKESTLLPSLASRPFPSSSKVRSFIQI